MKLVAAKTAAANVKRKCIVPPHVIPSPHGGKISEFKYDDVAVIAETTGSRSSTGVVQIYVARSVAAEAINLHCHGGRSGPGLTQGSMRIYAMAFKLNITVCYINFLE
jgi:hypothetical protein